MATTKIFFRKYKTIAQIRRTLCCEPICVTYFCSRSQFSTAKRNNKTASDNIFHLSDLPSLPVPILSRTVVNFLLFSKQVPLSDEDYGEALKVAQEFVNSDEVRYLQNMLQIRAKSMKNWLTPWWVNVAYLDARTPLPIITSPGMTLPKLNFKGVNGQIEYAAKIIHAALSFHHIIQNGELQHEKAGGEKLDMSQYSLIFGTTRLPRLSRDEIHYGKDRARWSQHIIVTMKGNSFQVNVYDNHGNVLSVSQIKAQLEEVVSQSNNLHFNNIGAVNVLSTDYRDNWANVYERVKTSSPNAVRSFEESLFVVCLDSGAKNVVRSTAEESMHQALHGGGSNHNTFNRWFDKAIQFYVNEDGYAGFTYEHTPAEGPPFAALLDYVQDQLKADKFDIDSTYSNAEVERPHRLKFRLIQEDKEAIHSAAQRIDTEINDLEVKSLTFDVFGKNVPKSMKMSPDSFIQLAMQLAFYKIHGTSPPTYETASLRRFAEGRTETIRLPNVESVRFVESVEKSNNLSELRSRLLDAVKAHKNYSVLAMNGAGMDRHLLGLKLMAIEEAKREGSQKLLKLPSLYSSKAYARLMHFQISSSQVPTRNELPMGYGPSANDCYAICYNPRESTINFTITALKSCAETSAERYADELRNALIKMKEIVSH